MKQKQIRPALFGLTILLAACASAPTLLHTLAGTEIAQTSRAKATYAITLDPVSVPRQVDIPQLVVTQADGSARLSETHRWMAPLGDEIRAGLSQQLQARLGVSDLSGVSPAAGLRVYRIGVDVQRFDALADGSVQLVAAWSLRDPAGTSAASCVTRVREEAVAADYAALVQGYRRALGGVAARIGDGIEALERKAAPGGCPT